MKKAKKKVNSCCKIVACSVITYLAIVLKFGITTVDYEGKGKLLLRILNCFEGFSLSRTLYFPLLLLFYQFIDEYINETARNSKSIRFISGLFSFFIVFGGSFEAMNSWDLVITKDVLQIMKALLLFTGWFVFLKKVIAYMFSCLDRYVSVFVSHDFQSKNCSLEIENLPLKISTIGKRTSIFQRNNTFFIIALILLILYIPYNLISYPGILMGDSRYQICQAFSELHYVERYNDAISLLTENVYITQHHPVMHTLLIHWCIVLGDYLKSFNFGLFLYSMLQEIIIITCIACATQLLCYKGTIRNGKRFVVFIILYFFGHPLIHRYMFLLSKDVIYSAFFLLLTGNLFILFSDTDHVNIYPFIGAMFSCVGMMLFRNEAQYVLLLSFVAIAIINPIFRKKALLLSSGVLLISITVFHIIYPSLGFTPGSRREMFSVPFQQTARYVKYYADEVTKEEQKAINAVLDYDTLAEKYNPNLSDPVKDKFKDQATNQDLVLYFKTWAKMLIKHPEAYIQATMNNYYQYFYPGKTRFNNYSYEWSSQCMEKVNRTLFEIRKEVHIWNKSILLRSLSDLLYNNLKNFPITSLLLTPAIYTWVILLLLFYSIYQQNVAAASFLLLPFSMIIITLLSPVNGYYGRYSFPLVVITPFLLSMCLTLFIKRRLIVSK